MIDSITSIRPVSVHEQDVVLSNLDIIENLVERGTGEVRAKGIIGENMNVYLKGNEIIIEGSLSQYYKSNSIDSLLWSEVPLAIEKLEKKLGIGMQSTKLLRVDIEATFLLPNLIKSYFEYLGGANYFNRFMEKSTLYYSNSCRKLCFYDKGAKIRKDYGAKYFQKGNLMRFEVRYKRRFIKQLIKKWGIQELELKHLSDSKFQKKFTELWFNLFNSIQKLPKLQLVLNEINGVGDLKKRLISQGVESLGGIAEVMDLLDRSRNLNPHINRKTLYKLKDCLKSHNNNPMNVFQSNHIEELIASINEAYHHNIFDLNDSSI